jgi:release factor glutamine methyltransferase
LNEHPQTIGSVLMWGANQLRATSPTARLDAELLLAHSLGWSRAKLLAEGRAILECAQMELFRALIVRRADLEPVAYIVGQREFYGLDVVVNRSVLIPRPETELLVELALQRARQFPGECTIGDICTGSGCIAVALAHHLPTAHVVATDLSPEALAVAAINVAHHCVAERVRLRQGDLLATLDTPVDLLVSNPPYTILAAIDEGVRRHEPWLALDGGADGLAIYRRLITQAPDYLRPGGALLLEIGADQGVAVSKLAQAAFPTANIAVHQDLAGLDRVVTVDL